MLVASNFNLFSSLTSTSSSDGKLLWSDSGPDGTGKVFTIFALQKHYRCVVAEGPISEQISAAYPACRSGGYDPGPPSPRQSSLGEPWATRACNQRFWAIWAASHGFRLQIRNFDQKNMVCVLSVDSGANINVGMGVGVGMGVVDVRLCADHQICEG